MKQIIFELTENEKQTIYGGETYTIWIRNEEGVLVPRQVNN